MPKRKADTTPKRKVAKQPRQHKQTESSMQNEELHEPAKSVDISSDTTGTNIVVPDFENLPTQVASYSDSLGVHVPLSVRGKIKNGEYIEMATLLETSPPNQKKSSTFVLVNGELQSQSINKIKLSDIGQWTDAFLIYISIFSESHPQTFQQLLKYMQTIRLAAGWSVEGWRKYDEQFRLKKARNPLSSLGEVDAELWLLYITQNQLMYGVRTTPATSLKCFDFNYKGFCSRTSCTYQHTCLECHTEHPSCYCPALSQGMLPCFPNIVPSFRNDPSVSRAAPFTGQRHQFNQPRPASRPRFTSTAMRPREIPN